MGLEEDLRELRAVDGQTATGRKRLEAALRRKSGLLVAAAADRVREADVPGLEAVLAKAFDTLCERPVKRDPGCRGKLALVRALDAADSVHDDVFERAARLQQNEPSWGGPSDTAGPVRTAGLFALVRMGHIDAAGLVADQLADPLPGVRREAARAATALGELVGAPLLRLKTGMGDEDDAVLSEALAGLCELQPEAGLRIAEAGLDGGERRREIAAFALGQSRLPQAVPLLVQACRRALVAEQRRSLRLALGSMRLEAARDALIAELDEAEPESVLEALGPYRFDRRTLTLALEAAPTWLHPRIRAALELPD